MTAPFVDELLRGRSDRHKPTYRQLREAGVSQRAIELLHEGRDMLAAGQGYYDFAKWCAEIWWTVPIAAADVPPMERAESVEHTFDLSGDWEALTEGVVLDWVSLRRTLRERAESREVEASNARQDARLRRLDRTKAARS